MTGSRITRERLVSELGLSPQQRQAIGLEEDTVVAAGAGAGKTTTLVGAVAHDLLVGGIAPDRICVCTFTRAAAGNLRSRLDEAVERLVGERAPDLGELWVGTIDALLNRLLKENALAAGLSPGFRVADERDLVVLQQEAARAALERLTDRELVEIDRVLDVTSEEELARLLRKSYEDARTLELGRPRSWSPQLVDPKQTISALQELLAVASEKQAAQIERDIANISAGNFESVSTGKWRMRETSRNSGLLAAAVEARERWRQAQIDAALEPAREALERAFEIYAQEYSKRKRAEELLDFGDLADEAERLATGGELRRGFLRTYIDETQDTNPRQYRILRALSDGPVVSIGDVNQSIYSFRGADVDVFRREAASASRHVTLSDNYRSRPEVLEAVNELCGRLPALAEGMIRMRSAGPKAELEPLSEPAVEALCFTLPQSRMPSAEKEAAVAAPHIVAAARRRGIALRDVCVLVRENREVGAYTEAFRRIGAPALAIQRRGFFEHPEVLDVLAYLRLLVDPDDEEALLRVLTSPFCGLSDAELYAALEGRATQLRRLREELGRDPVPQDEGYPLLGERIAGLRPEFWATHEEILSRRGRGSPAALLRRAVEAHGFDLALEALDGTGARWRNVEKLLHLIGELERGGVGASPRALVERLEVERAADKEGQDERPPADLDAVRVMTVHQAKGDEFKLVAVARLSRASYIPPPRLVIDGCGRIGLKRAGKSRDERIEDSAYRDQRLAETRRKLEEEWRVLYVALTRAEEHLILVGAGCESESGEARWEEPLARLLDPAEIPDEPGVSRVIGCGEGRICVRRLDAQAAAAEAPEPPDPGRHAEEEEPDGELTVTDPELPAIAPGVLSYTSLASWRRCSLRRWIERDLALRRLPSFEGEDAGDAGEGSGAREFGAEIHRAIARLRFAPGEDPAHALAATGLRGDGRAQAMLQELLGSPLAAEIRGAERVEREVAFDLVLGRHLLQGRIDLLAWLGDEALVVDWKSGQDPDDVFGADYALQRRLYALAALSSEAPPSRARAVSYPLAGGEPVSEVFTLEQREELRAGLLRQIERILGLEPVAAAQGEPAPFCRDCPGLERICPLSRLTDPRPAAAPA